MNLKQLLEKQQQDFQQVDSVEYQKKMLKLAPRPAVVKNAILAFVVGGLICTIGQVLTNLFSSGGLVDREAGTAASTVLVFAGALLTGLGIYDELGRVAGAGSIVPITGFANSIASSALEFKREGFVYGVGARLFTVAGPVIVYGTIVSIFIGLIYYFVK
ncbi:MAG: stage V sporulation protein AC [Peptococcaceae bacterium]|nr:stage V sporulation protein AC [Peptococcaceae bacterium]MDH7525307.1 stage V sporulation protein AC [Peptococcaceae bacterium]